MPNYKNISDIVNPAVERGISLGQSVILDEMEESGKSREEIVAKMHSYLNVMRKACEEGSKETLVGPLFPADAYQIQQGIEKGIIPNDFTARAVQKAIAVNGLNSLSGKVVATPTGGACGILPGVLLAAQEEWGYEDEKVVESMFAAAGTGIPVALNGTLSGSVGGCQAECGSGAAMAAAALTDLRGGTPEQVAHAFAIACKASMGLICDPMGSISCPCVKRNGLYASVAISAAYMALCGVKSMVPPDEVLLCFCDVSLKVGQRFSKLDGRVGLQNTPFAMALDPRMYN
jgi:L-serine dehydratase